MKAQLVTQLGLGTVATKQIGQPPDAAFESVHGPSFSGHGENGFARAAVAPPCRGFVGELFSSGGAEPVELGAAVVLGRSPRGLDPAAVLQPMEGGIERTLIDLEHATRD